MGVAGINLVAQGGNLAPNSQADTAPLTNILMHTSAVTIITISDAVSESMPGDAGAAPPDPMDTNRRILADNAESWPTTPSPKCTASFNSSPFSSSPGAW